MSILMAGCRYCLEGCPEDIQIHLYLTMWDQVRMKFPEEAERVCKVYLATEDRWLKGKRATDCTECGECETLCTQKLPIREYLEKIGRIILSCFSRPGSFRLIHFFPAGNHGLDIGKDCFSRCG